MGLIDDNAGKFYVYEGKAYPADSLASVVEPDSSVYEVIRIIDGVPLFLADHFNRMLLSLNALKKRQAIRSEITLDQVGSGIKALLNASGEKFCNVKIMAKIKKGCPELIFYISKSFYPPKEMVNAGVSTGLLRIERNDPNAKVLDLSYKTAVAGKMKEGDYFEVLLVNRENKITEGSKSNVFFVKGDRILTAPGSHVLLGITRKYVIEACNKTGVQVEEAFTGVDELPAIDAVFLSGTSIKVLPVSKIENTAYRSPENPIIKAVIKEYDEMIGKYIEGHGNLW